MQEICVNTSVIVGDSYFIIHKVGISLKYLALLKLFLHRHYGLSATENYLEIFERKLRKMDFTL